MYRVSRKGARTVPCRPRTADNYVRHTVPSLLILWLVGDVVEDPGSEEHRNTVFCVHRTNEAIFYIAEETFVALYSSINYHEISGQLALIRWCEKYPFRAI